MLDDSVLSNFNVDEAANFHDKKRLLQQFEPDYIRRAFPRLEAVAAQPILVDPGDEGKGEHE